MELSDVRLTTAAVWQFTLVVAGKDPFTRLIFAVFEKSFYGMSFSAGR
jgi:hypothetical protein